MAIHREQIAQRVKGSLAENEDFWTLCYDADAQRFYVEHEWSHMNPYKLSDPGSHGTSQHDADAWTGAGAEKIDEAKRRLIEKAAV
jgi:hypothetical protein